VALEEYGYTITEKKADEEWSATEYKILHAGSGGGTFARENSQATVVYLVEYYYFEQFLDVVMGKTVLGEDGLLSRSATDPEFDTSQGSLPEAHPYCANYYAASAEVVPMGQSTQEWYGPLWSKAAVTVVFRPTTYNVVSDDDYTLDTEVGRFVTKTNEGSADFQTAQGQFRFVTDPQHRPLEIQPGIVIANQKMMYTWHQVPVYVDPTTGLPDLGQIPNIETVIPLVGTVNEVEFDGYPPGTVLFSGYTPRLIQPQAANDGSYYWDITYMFGYRNYGESDTPVVTGEHIGWNYAYDPTRHLWDLYTDDGFLDGKTLYKYADINPLFTVTW
jgi:hypothetical protein